MILIFIIIFFKSEKINIIFKATDGIITSIIYDYGTTVDEALNQYLLKINRTEFYNTKKINFVYNCIGLKFGDQTKIENFFGNKNHPIVTVIFLENANYEEKKLRQLIVKEKVIQEMRQEQMRYRNNNNDNNNVSPNMMNLINLIFENKKDKSSFIIPISELLL